MFFCGDGECQLNETAFECNQDCNFYECLPFVDPEDNGCPADLGFGTCLATEEDIGLCIHSGPGEVGEPCRIVNNIFWGMCVGDALCIPERDSNEGTCVRMCPSFDDVSSCDQGEACGVLNDGITGYCAPTGTPEPIQQLDACFNQGDWCSDESICVDTGGPQGNFCLKLCRLDFGSDDCDADAAPNCDDVLQSDFFGLCVP